MMKASAQKQRPLVPGPRAHDAGSTLFHPSGLMPASPAQSPLWEWQAYSKLSPPHDSLKPPTSGLRLPPVLQQLPQLTGHPPPSPGSPWDRPWTPGSSSHETLVFEIFKQSCRIPSGSPGSLGTEHLPFPTLDTLLCDVAQET